MASYHTRQRDPLLDHRVQAMLERRGRELFGLFLIALALLYSVTGTLNGRLRAARIAAATGPFMSVVPNPCM